MRRLLMSAAALVFLTVPALAQPGNDRGADRGEKAHGASQAQDRGQAGERQAAPQQQGSSPFDRGHGADRRGAQQPAPVAQQVAPSSQSQGAQPQAVPSNRGDRGRNVGQGFGGQTNGGGFNRSDNRPNNYQGNNSGNRAGRSDNRSGFGNGGSRRDFSNFRDYHRTFNAPRRFRAPDYRRPNGWYDHRWSFGEFLPSLFWGSSYWLNDYSRYDLPPPPYGAVWVREGRDALLVDRDSGEIITVEYDVFY